MKNNDLPNILLTSASLILRPLIRILLRYGISYTAFSELAMRIYFDVAKSDFVIPGKKQTTSRISTMTGLSRRVVARMEARPEQKDTLDTTTINRAARVISGWVRDTDFHNLEGGPTDLPLEGDMCSFSELVKRYSGDITVRTISDELTRIGAISVTPSGLLHLNTHAYVVSDSVRDKLTLLGMDVSNLITTIEHNIVYPEQPYFQRKVAYNYIPGEILPEIKDRLASIAQESLESMDDVLASKAINKDDKQDDHSYIRTGFGIYFFKEDQL